MKNGIGGNAGSGMLGDIAGLGIGLGAMGSVIGMTKDAIGSTMDDGSQIGQQFGKILSVSEAAQTDSWDCSCGQTGITGNFCMNCGAKKPEPIAGDTWDCACGQKRNTGNFCMNCGAKKPEPEQADTWDCACGQKGNTGNFCMNCGAKRPPKKISWDCTCGQKNITGNFCPNCGSKRREE
ncbi:MAG: hypothetical protein IJW67_09495 [Blautia sp.]|nr:hypothetical protein [Blautia sp.]